MENIQIFLLKSVITLSSLYVFYWLLLRNEIFHTLNRSLLIIIMVIAIVLPMINVYGIEYPPATMVNTLDPMILNAFADKVPVSSDNSMSILSIIYISGTVFFALRFLSGLAKIQFMILRFPKYDYKGFKAVVLDNDQSPFTFFNILFISQKDFKSDKINEMIIHEKAHKNAGHSYDIMLLEFITIIQWFNPFIWLLRFSLKSEHEYIADSKVLNEGYGMAKYQKLLFEKSLGITAFNFTNHFNYSLLKKRLKMMKKNKANFLVRFKYILSVPLMVTTIILLIANFNAYGQKGKTHTQVDVMAEYNDGGIPGVKKFIQQNMTYPKIASESGYSGKIFVEFDVDKNGKVRDPRVVKTNINLTDNDQEVVVVGYTASENTEIDPDAVKALENEAIRVISLLGDWTPGQKDGKNVKVMFTFPIVFKLQKEKDS